MNKTIVTVLSAAALALITLSMADSSGDRMSQLASASNLAQKAQADVAQFQQQQQQKFASMQKRLASPNAQNLATPSTNNSATPSTTGTPYPGSASSSKQPAPTSTPANNNITGFSSSPSDNSGDSSGWNRDYY